MNTIYTIRNLPRDCWYSSYRIFNFEVFGRTPLSLQIGNEINDVITIRDLDRLDSESYEMFLNFLRSIKVCTFTAIIPIKRDIRFAENYFHVTIERGV